MKFITAAGMLLAGALVLSGCSIEGEDSASNSGSASDQVFSDPNSTIEDSYTDTARAMKGKKIAFVPLLLDGYGLTSNWYENMKRSLEPMGADVKAYDANFDPEKMVSTVDQIIREKSADVLVLHNIDVGILSSQIESAEAAGIYVVTVNMLGNRLGDAYVGPNTSRAASDIADRAVVDCRAKKKDKLTIIDGPGTDAASIEWSENISRVAKKAGLSITEVAHSDYVDSKASEIARTTLSKHGDDVCGFMVLFDGNSIAVGDAVQEAEKDGRVEKGSVGVYTFSADKRVCNAMDKGQVTAAAAYDVPGMGSAVTSTIQQLLETKQTPGTFHTVSLLGHEIVDKDNKDDFNVACWANK